MPFYEIIFETGSKSVAEYKDDDEAMAAINAHHDRAKNGEPGGPTGAPAERVSRILKYDVHPGTLNEDMTMSKEVFETELKKVMKDQGNVVNVMDVAASVRALADPHVADLKTMHDSQYKMKEADELKAPA